MLRSKAKLICLVVIALLSLLPTGHAQISRQNPYRSFNIGGVNYGSMRWEQQHRSQMKQPTRYLRLSPRILVSRRR